jgi:hypothetical protein
LAVDFRSGTRLFHGKNYDRIIPFALDEAPRRIAPAGLNDHFGGAFHLRLTWPLIPQDSNLNDENALEVSSINRV